MITGLLAADCNAMARSGAEQQACHSLTQPYADRKLELGMYLGADAMLVLAALAAASTLLMARLTRWGRRRQPAPRPNQ